MRPNRRCMPYPTRPPELTAIRGRCTGRRRVSPKPTVSHARLLVTGSRRWGVPMLHSRVTELHYITPVANLGSIVTHGLLSHNLAARLRHASVPLEPVQDRRAQRRVPQGRPLHDYVNLYFDARNPMMYKLLKDGVGPLIVCRVDPVVLHLPGSVVTDGNAASDGTIFMPSPSGLVRLSEDRIYAGSWDDQDYWTKIELKRARCAELLVPDRVDPQFVLGCYVDHRNRRSECFSESPRVHVEVNSRVFFN
ncbi:MAG: DUF4433 domain-containing protein [Pseudonocardiaceae bacterium]